MGTGGNCDAAWASLSGDVAYCSMNYDACPGYQVQSGDTWYAMTSAYYGTTDSIAIQNFANNSGLGTDQLDTGWWLYLPYEVEDSVGTLHQIRCQAVGVPCETKSPDIPYYVVYSECPYGTHKAPANGSCNY